MESRFRLRQAINPLRRGLTVIEILVVTGILGVLVTLTAAAVQSSRQTARRMQCASQLKQVSLAIISFEAAQAHYPKPTFDGHTNRDLQQQVAGYLEIPDLPVVASPNHVRPNVSFLACPADPHALGQFGLLSGTYWISDGLGNLKHPDGIWAFRGPPVRARDITDGLSNTALSSEKLSYPDLIVVDWTLYPEHRNRILLTTPGLATTIEGWADECEFQAGLPIQGADHYQAYTHVVPPNRNSCIFGLSGPPTMVTASSLHGGGVNLALADGSLRFVAETVDRKVWHQIGKRNDDEGAIEW